MGQIWDFFSSNFSTFWLGKPKCTEMLFEKVPDLSHLGANMPHFGPESDIPVPNNSIGLYTVAKNRSTRKALW